MKPKRKRTLCKLSQRWEKSYDGMWAKRLYKKHLKKLRNMRSVLDMKPRTVIAPSVLIAQRLKHDAVTAHLINAKNKDLLQKIYSTRKFVSKDSLSHRPADLRLQRKASWRASLAKLRLDEIERGNRTLACKILTVKSTINTRTGLAGHIQALRQSETFEIAPETRYNYAQILMPGEQGLLERLLRPKIYFELEVKNAFPLGRVLVQLFTEACPEVVLEFVRLCQKQSVETLQFIRIFSKLWIEGELMVSNATLKEAGFEHDMYVIDHGHGIGVFSFAQSYLDGFTNGLINFTISFKPLPVLNGFRVPFGIVTRGRRVIECIEIYGTKNGKPKKEIIVTKCGMFY